MTVADNKFGRVGYKQASWDEVEAEIGNDERFPPNMSYVLLERTEHIEFVTKAQANANDFFAQHWTSGRLFNETWELHFEKQGETYRLRFLTEGNLPEGWEQQAFETNSETSLLLFGERKRETDPGWREARIPRWLQYPVSNAGKRVRLIAIPYLRDGMIVRMRLKGVTSDAEASTEA
jgi:hypothetical protein